MSKRLKLAVCVSGQPRTWRYCKPSLDNLFKEFDVDYVLHSWADTPAEEQAALLHAYQPVASALTPRPDFSTHQQNMARRFPVIPPLNSFDMAWGIQQAITLALNNGGYDLIARVRFDSIFKGRFGHYRLKKKAMFVPEWPDAAGYNDQFAIGTPEAMHIYAGYVDWLKSPQLCSYQPNWFRPEQGLRTYLEQYLGADSIVSGPMDTKLLRPTMIGRDYDHVYEDIFNQVYKQIECSEFTESHNITVQYSTPIISTLSQMRNEHLFMQSYIVKDNNCEDNIIKNKEWKDKILELDKIILEARTEMYNNNISMNQIIKFISIFLHLHCRDTPMDANLAILMLHSTMRGDQQRAVQWIQQNQKDFDVAFTDSDWLSQMAILGPLFREKLARIHALS